MSRNNAVQRGYTIAELGSVMFSMGLVLGAIALIIGPLLASQNRAQAKVDTVQAAAAALYRVERDLRNTNLGSVYSCTTGAAPVCATPPPSLTGTTAIVIVTAYRNGTGQFQLTSAGKPNWQGAAVYWVDAAGDLTFGFDAPTSTGYQPGNLLSVADAQAAVADVTASGGKQLARWIQQMSIGVPGNGHQMSFQLQTRSTVGSASNETTYRTDLETRN